MSDRNDDLGRHIGTLWKTAIAGLDTMREVVSRSTQTGRLRIDIALLARERSQLLEALGEMVVGLVDEGAWEDPPESVRQAYERIKDVEGQLKSDRIKASDNAFGAPRGFEPEAASDYGDDPDDEDLDAGDDAEEVEAAPPPPRRPPRPRRKATAGKRRSRGR